MRKLLNTLYVIDEKSYLFLDGETVVCKSDERESLKIPFSNIESIYCFSYLGCSPALMGKCADKGVSLVFFTPTGRFLARVSGKSAGNVYTRVMQTECFKQNELMLVRNNVATKLRNTRFLLNRSIRDNIEIGKNEKVVELFEKLKLRIEQVYIETDIDVIRGIEGICAKEYFSVFDILILNKNDIFKIYGRSKHPPLDATNALLSFLYSMATNDLASALEGVGLDSYIGFYHVLREGRVSLACDLVEEIRSVIERLAISLINLKVLDENDFKKEITGAVFLNDEGRKKVLKAWQEKKRSDFVHPFLKEKIQFGLLPFVQSNLLAKFVRGEIDEYPSFIQR